MALAHFVDLMSNTYGVTPKIYATVVQDVAPTDAYSYVKSIDVVIDGIFLDCNDTKIHTERIASIEIFVLPCKHGNYSLQQVAKEHSAGMLQVVNVIMTDVHLKHIAETHDICLISGCTVNPQYTDYIVIETLVQALGDIVTRAVGCNSAIQLFILEDTSVPTKCMNENNTRKLCNVLRNCGFTFIVTGGVETYISGNK